MRLTMRRLGGLAVAVACLTTVACGTSDSDAGDAGDVITLRFLSYNFGTPDLGGQGTQELIDQFEAAHPNIRIEAEGTTAGDALTNARAAVAGGEPYDVAQLGWSKMGEARTSLPITPVQSIPSSQDWDDHTAGFAQNVLDAVAVDGTVDAMPYTMSTPTVFYNADLFRAAGLDPENPPQTMDEVRSAGLAIANTGAQGVYFGVVDPNKSDFMTQSVINGNGGGVVNGDGEVTVDQRPAVEALAEMQEMTTSGAQPAVAAADALGAFKAGELGMLVTSTGLLASLEEAAEGAFELRTGAFPRFGEQEARPTYSGAGLVVMSEDQQRQEAAWEFIRFLTSAEGFTIVTEMIGYLPLRPDIVDDPEYLADYFAENDRLQPAMEQLDSVAPYTYFSGDRAFEAVTVLQDDAVEPIVLRGADPAATLGETADRIRSIVDE